MNGVTQTFGELLEERRQAKKAEDMAIALRRGLDEKIAALMRDPKKPEGSISQTVGDIKVATTFGVTRKVDTPAVQNDWEELPETVRAIFKFGAEVSVTAYRELSADDLLVAAKYITSKPSTPSVKLELA